MSFQQLIIQHFLCFGHMDRVRIWHTMLARGATASTLSTETIALTPEFNIYPNPVTNELSVEFPSAVTQATISVYSVLGTLVYSSTMDQWNSKINTSEWNTGVYLMNINTANFSQTKRIIKQ